MATSSLLGYIPSPSANGLSVGPVRLHIYGLMIALGVLTAVWMSQRQWTKMGGKAGTCSMLAVWGVPGGLIGARIYSLVTSWNADTGGSVVTAFEIWHGGLGIWGGILCGVLSGLYGAHNHGLPTRPLLDAVAPALPLAQAVGRFGNYFNQELYGRPTTRPWGLKIDRSIQLQDPNLHGRIYAAFQPTFLYESIWDVLVALVVLWVGRRFRLRRGYLFAVYSGLYCVGRFGTEYLRVDEAHRIYGLRLNDWTCILVFTVSAALLLTRGRPGPGDDVAMAPLEPPAGHAGPDVTRPDVPDAVVANPDGPTPAAPTLAAPTPLEADESDLGAERT